jgi:hypothetical protein
MTDYHAAQERRRRATAAAIDALAERGYLLEHEQREILEAATAAKAARDACDCRRQRNILWSDCAICLSCGKSVALKPERNRLREWTREHAADLLLAAVPAALALGYMLAAWLE